MPRPRDPGAPVARLVAELAALLGTRATVDLCCDLLGGADREDHLDVLPYLTGHDWRDGAAVRDPASWRDYWVRTWGARGLLHVWADDAAPAVVDGLGDPHWRPAEMCLKICARHEVAASGDAAAVLAAHRLPRVRAQAARALAVVGDTEHRSAVRSLVEDPDPAVRDAAARAWSTMTERLS